MPSANAKGKIKAVLDSAPVITSPSQSASLSEWNDGSAAEVSNVVHSAAGQISYSDADPKDVHSSSFSALGAGYVGSFALDTSKIDRAGSVGWSFAVSDVTIDYLSGGQTLTQSYNVSISDGQGGTASQVVTVNLVGVNDAPTINVGVQQTTVTEWADGSASEATNLLHVASGQIGYGDVDLTDTHTATFQPRSGNYLGAFSLNTSAINTGKTVGWSFAVSDHDIDSLSAGQTLTQLYDVKVDDGHGGIASQTVEVDIVGVGDALSTAASSALPITPAQPSLPLPGPSASGLSSTPSLGTNLEGLAYWATSVPMLDLMKSAGAWSGVGPNQSLDLDEHGWVRSIPVGDTGVFIPVIRENPAAPPDAHYVVLYEGSGTIEGALGTKVLADSSVPGRLVLQAADDGSVHLQITSIDQGDYLHDIHVVREDQLPLYEAGLTFNPAFLDKVDDFHTFRFMDWMDTNQLFNNAGQQVGWDQNGDYTHIGQLDWANRPQLSDAQWDRGVPVEAMVELANRAGTDVWFNMPTNASDDYVRGFASYVKDHLRPDLNIHVEYSNEVWNWGFLQSGYAQQQAQAEWGSDASWMEWYGQRTAQIGSIWNDVFGEAETHSGAHDSDRVSVVYNTQFAWKGLEDYGLDTPHWTDASGNHIQAADYFDEYAVTGYYNGSLSGEDDVAKVMSSWSNPDGGYGQALAAIGDNIANYNAPLYQYHAEKAHENGLDLVTYESGFGDQTPQSQLGNQAYTDFLINLQSQPGIYDLEQQNYAAFKDAGGDLYMNFEAISQPSKWGSWGALESVTQDTSPRYQALTDWNSSTSPWYETGRDTTTFQDARYYIAGNGAETIAGTLHGFDVLVGGSGDDTFVPYGSGSTLDGRDGNDTLWLQGAQADYTFTLGQDGWTHVTGNGAEWEIHSIETIRYDPGMPLPWGGNETTGTPAHTFSTVILGTDGDDLLVGGDGNDRLDGSAGNDELYGGAGNDSLEGWIGDDKLWGDDGDDQLRGGDGNDRLDGGAGDDQLWGGSGDDFLEGWKGNDQLVGDDGNDEMRGGEGNDHLDGGAGADLLFGWTGDDFLEGWIGNDRLYGEDGRDELHGGDGQDALDGGADDDLLFGGSGDDFLEGWKGDDRLFGDDGRDELRGGEGNDRLDGGADDDRLFGWTGNDFLEGSSGNDQLFGEDGDDDLHGGEGDDRLEGGAGNDMLQGWTGHDRFVFNGAFGRDIIQDFHQGEDVIELSRSQFPDFASVQAHSTQSGNDTVIMLDADHTITLWGVQLASLHQDAFAFV